MRDCVVGSVPQFVSFLSSCSEIRAMGILDFLCGFINFSYDGPIFICTAPLLPLWHGKYDLQSQLIHISDLFFCPTVFRLGCSASLVIEPALQNYSYCFISACGQASLASPRSSCSVEFPFPPFLPFTQPLTSWEVRTAALRNAVIDPSMTRQGRRKWWHVPIKRIEYMFDCQNLRWYASCVIAREDFRGHGYSY